MPGLLSLAANVSIFNGGLTQVGLGAPGYEEEFNYINHLKLFQGITNAITGGQVILPSDLTQDGYPTASFDYVAKGGIYGVGYIPTQTERPGLYKVTWDGTGVIYCPNTTGAIGGSGSKSVSGFTFTPSSNRISIGIQAGTDVRNLQLFHVDDEPDLLSGKKFQSRFMGLLKALRPRRIRFMDWQSANFGALAQWKYRATSSHICPAGFDPRPDLYAGSTTNSGDAFSITFNDPYYGAANPVHGQTFLLRWSATAASNSPTLAYNSFPAKPILRPDGGAQFTGGNTGRPGANFVAPVIYDANFDAWLCYGTASASAFLDNGMPYEDMIDMCKEVGCHPHWVISTPVAADGPTDFVTGLATLAKTKGPTWFKPAFECGTNECFTSGFNGTQYAMNIQKKRYGFGITFTNTIVEYTGNGASGSSTLTFSDNAPPLGANVVLGTYNATTGDRFLFGFNGNSAYVQAANVGGNPLKVTINGAPNAGSGASPWTGSTTVSVATADYSNWYGRVVSLNGQAVSAVYSGDTTKYDVLCGVQTGAGITNAEGSAPRLDSTSYVLTGGSPAYNWVTEGTWAQYWNTGNYAWASELIAAWAYWNGDSSQAPAYLDRAGDSTGASSDGFTRPQLQTANGNWKTFFSKAPRNIKKGSGYEGGYSNNFSLRAPSPQDVTSTVAGISNAAQAVISCSNSSFGGISRTGIGIDNSCVGMMVSVSSIGAGGPVNMNCVTGTATFTNGSATIARANNFVAGQMVNFTTSGVLPAGTGFAVNTPLYVVNPTSSTFQVSTTKGGSAIVFNTAGQSGTHTVQSGFRVVAADALANTITVDYDTSNTTNYPPYVSGGSLMYVNGRVMVNKLRADAKQVTSSPAMPGTGMKGWTKAIINDFLGLTDANFTAHAPSQYLFCAPTIRPDRTGDVGEGQVWGALNDGVWTANPCPMYVGNQEINLGI